MFFCLIAQPCVQRGILPTNSWSMKFSKFPPLQGITLGMHAWREGSELPRCSSGAQEGDSMDFKNDSFLTLSGVHSTILTVLQNIWGHNSGKIRKNLIILWALPSWQPHAKTFESESWVKVFGTNYGANFTLRGMTRAGTTLSKGYPSA